MEYLSALSHLHGYMGWMARHVWCPLYHVMEYSIEIRRINNNKNEKNYYILIFDHDFFNTEDKKEGASFFPSKHIFTYFYFVTSNFFFSYYIKKELFSSVCKWVKGVVWIMWKHILHDSFFFFSLFFRKIILWLRFERRLKCKYLLSEYLYVLFFFFFSLEPVQNSNRETCHCRAIFENPFYEDGLWYAPRVSREE